MIIAVDPGNTTGVAIFAGRAPAFAKVDRPDVGFVHALLSWCKAKSAALGRTLTLVIEDQYVDRRKAKRKGKMVPLVDTYTVIELARNAEAWRVIADLLGIQWTRTMPSKWQGPMLRTAPTSIPGKTKTTTKHRAQWVVRETWETLARFWTLPEAPAKVVRVLSDKVPIDPCDALLIGRWYELHGMHETGAR